MQWRRKLHCQLSEEPGSSVFLFRLSVSKNSASCFHPLSRGKRNTAHSFPAFNCRIKRIRDTAVHEPHNLIFHLMVLDSGGSGGGGCSLLRGPHPELQPLYFAGGWTPFHPPARLSMISLNAARHFMPLDHSNFCCYLPKSHEIYPGDFDFVFKREIKKKQFYDSVYFIAFAICVHFCRDRSPTLQQGPQGGSESLQNWEGGHRQLPRQIKVCE